MEKNENQLTQIFQKEEAFQTLTLINTWLSNMDVKVSLVLALVGALMGIIFSDDNPKAFQIIVQVIQTSGVAELNGGEIFAAILVAILYLSNFISLMCFMQVLKAKIKNPNNDSSLFFFRSINDMNLQDYIEKINQVTERELIEDLVEQIHTNSMICTQKVIWYNKGIKFLLVTIILWFLCVCFRLL